MRTHFALVGLLVLGLAAGALADDTTGTRGTPPPCGTTPTTDTCDAEPRKPTRAYGVDWHHDVGTALEAAAEKRKRRPVLLLRVLGDVVGKT